MISVWIKFVVLVGVLVLDVSSQDPVITLPQGGDVLGKFETSGKAQYTAFRGIPYAKAPIGDLRLKNPEELDRSTSRLDATEFKPECPQWNLQGKSSGSEDCLYLNVYTPAEMPVRTADHPVMVFIHGGNFQRGSADPYGASRFMDNGVVLVTFNYRLGILGFLSTGDSSCPGNLGLKDQVLALQWVRNNIGAFGGKSSMITIFGQDAGAASVFLHILSPMSKGLFQYAIMQSGSPLCDWSIEENPYTYATEIAKRLRCSTKSTGGMIDCIRKQTTEDILDAQKENKTFGDFPYRAIAVVEKNKDGFLPDTPSKLLSSGGYQVPLTAGINKDDGAVFYPLVNSYREELRRNSSFLRAQLIPKFLLTATDIRGNIESVTQALLFEYFNEADPVNVTQVLQPFVNMTTDAMFVSCNYKTLQLYSAAGAPVYMYTFEYRGEKSMLNLEQKEPINFPGVSHGDELMYLFNIQNAEIKTGNDEKMANQLMSLWVNFAKTGKSSDTVTFQFPKWEPYTNELKNFYRIQLPQTELDIAYRKRAVDLWLNLLPSLSNITGHQVEYKTGSLGWTMLAIALILLIAVVVLGVMLFRKSKSQYFQASTEKK